MNPNYRYPPGASTEDLPDGAIYRMPDGTVVYDGLPPADRYERGEGVTATVPPPREPSEAELDHIRAIMDRAAERDEPSP